MEQSAISISHPRDVQGARSKIYMRAPGTMIKDRVTYAVTDTALGQILVARTTRGICAILFGSDTGALARDLATQIPNAELVADEIALSQTLNEVRDFVEAPFGTFDAPLDIGGTLFQQQVWQALREIPAGTTASYADVAAHIGRPEAVRAVANACAANVLAVAIPCHRVVRNDGSLSGYRWGVERKRELLRMEANA